MSNFEIIRIYIALYIIDKINNISDTDFTEICYQSLLFDFINLSHIKNILNSRNLAISQISKLKFDVDGQNNSIIRWKITDKGRQALKNINFDSIPHSYLSNISNFCTALISEQAKNYKYICNPPDLYIYKNDKLFREFSLKFTDKILENNQFHWQELKNIWLSSRSLENKLHYIEECITKNLAEFLY